MGDETGGAERRGEAGAARPTPISDNGHVGDQVGVSRRDWANADAGKVISRRVIVEAIQRHHATAIVGSAIEPEGLLRNRGAVLRHVQH